MNRSLIVSLPIILCTALLIFAFQNCGQGFKSIPGALSTDGLNFKIGSIGGSLSYYGYFGDSQRGFGNGNYMTEIADHANYTFIYGNEDGIEDSQKLRQAKDLNLKAIMLVSGIFFRNNLELKPASEYQPLWDQYVSRIKSLEDNVLAFFVVDEMDLANFIHVAHLDWNLQAQTWPQRRVDLETVGAIIKRSFPNKPIMVNFAPGSLGGNTPNNQHIFNNYWQELIPRNFDWISFDCYGPFENCMGLNHSVAELLEVLKRHSRSHQKFFLLPDGTDFTKYLAQDMGLPNFVWGEDQLIPLADKYLQLAKTEPRVIGLMTFMWQTETPDDGRTLTGVRDMPRLKQKFIEIGRLITGRSSSPGGNSPTHPGSGNPQPQTPNPCPDDNRGCGSCDEQQTFTLKKDCENKYPRCTPVPQSDGCFLPIQGLVPAPVSTPVTTPGSTSTTNNNPCPDDNRGCGSCDEQQTFTLKKDCENKYPRCTPIPQSDGCFRPF